MCGMWAAMYSYQSEEIVSLNYYRQRHKSVTANFTKEQAEQLKQIALEDGETASRWLLIAALAALKERLDEAR